MAISRNGADIYILFSIYIVQLVCIKKKKKKKTAKEATCYRCKRKGHFGAPCFSKSADLEKHGVIDNSATCCRIVKRQLSGRGVFRHIVIHPRVSVACKGEAV